jgi:hypothetical protein
MRRAAVIAVLTLTAVTGASLAEAAIGAGVFIGSTTNARDPVGFKVPAKNRVSNFYVDGVRLKCTNGDQFDSGKGDRRLRSPAGTRFRVNSNGKFTVTVANNDVGNGFSAHGRFHAKGTTATGWLQVYAHFDANNNPSSKGSVHCSSGKIRFRANRK